MIVLDSEIIKLILSQNYDSNISRQLFNNFKTLTILSIIWSSAPLIHHTYAKPKHHEPTDIDESYVKNNLPHM